MFGNAGSTSSAISGAAVGSEAISSNLGDAESSAKAIKKSLAGFDQINVLSSGSGDSSGASGGTGGASGDISSEGMSAASEAGNKYVAVLDTIKQKLEDIVKLTGMDYAWYGLLSGITSFKNGILNLVDSAKGAFAQLTPNFETLKTNLGNTLTTMATTFTTIWGDMWRSLGANFEEFTVEYGPQIQEFIYNTGLAFTNFGTLASTAIGDVFGSLKSWWESDGLRIFGAAQKILYDVGGIIMKLWNEWVFPVIQHLQGAFAELWANHLKPLWDEVLKVATSIGDAVIALWNNPLKPIVNWIVNLLGPPIVNVCHQIINVFKTVIAGISDGIKAGLKALRGLLDFITGVFSGDWKKAWNGIKTYFSGIWDGLVNVVKVPVNLIIDLVEGMANGVISALNGMVRAINGLSFDVPDWVPGLGGKKFGLNLKQISKISIPRLATGGYVEANTPQLAIIGDNKREGEIVAPESKITEAVVAAFRQFLPLFNNGGNNKPIYLTLKLGDGTFWEGFVDYHNDIVKRTGDTPLLI